MDSSAQTPSPSPSPLTATQSLVNSLPEWAHAPVALVLLCILTALMENAKGILVVILQWVVDITGPDVAESALQRRRARQVDPADRARARED